jgi:hypothetical protein
MFGLDQEMRARGGGGLLMKRPRERRCNRGTLHLRSSQTRELTSKGVRQFGAAPSVSTCKARTNRRHYANVPMPAASVRLGLGRVGARHNWIRYGSSPSKK